MQEDPPVAKALAAERLIRGLLQLLQGGEGVESQVLLRTNRRVIKTRVQTTAMHGLSNGVTTATTKATRRNTFAGPDLWEGGSCVCCAGHDGQSGAIRAAEALYHAVDARDVVVGAAHELEQALHRVLPQHARTCPHTHRQQPLTRTGLYMAQWIAIMKSACLCDHQVLGKTVAPHVARGDRVQGAPG